MSLLTMKLSRRRLCSLGCFPALAAAASEGCRYGVIDPASTRISEKASHFSSIPLTSSSTLTAFGAVQSLAHRLQEPSPLRATSSTAAKKKSPEERQRLGEMASELVQGYSSLPALRTPLTESCERGRILLFLASDCGHSMEAVQKAVDHYQRILHRSSGDQDTVEDDHSAHAVVPGSSAIDHLRHAATPPYEELIGFVLKHNAVTGMAFLLSLREDLLEVLAWMKSTRDDTMPSNDRTLQTQLHNLDIHLCTLFTTWFTPGMLDIRRITYDNTSASIIEMIATKEAVHPMKSLEDLRSRLGSGRRVFALFHPVLPGKPLVFVHVALLTEIPSSMGDVMWDFDQRNRNDTGKNSAAQPRVAAFYSISNGQRGLSGAGLGEYLLKEAIRELKTELPSLDTFVTLSPVPRFRKWLQVKVNQHKDESILSSKDRDELVACGLIVHGPEEVDEFPWQSFWNVLEQSDFSPEGAGQDIDSKQQQERLAVLRKILLKLASRYLVTEKHRGKPLDQVCKFHVGNGAQVYDLNFAADTSRGGMANSFGVMVNYLYDLEQIKSNQANFELDYTVAVSQRVYHLLDTDGEEGADQV